MQKPTSDQLKTAQELRAQMSGWRAIDELITSVFRRYGQNSDRFLVLLKVRLINRLYNTSIKAEYQLAQHIVRHDALLSTLLAEGNADAIQRIANFGKNRREQVFASKFAHFHQPERFAIGDKYVDKALKALGLKPWNRSVDTDGIAKAYQGFYDQIRAITRERQISLKEADQYLWLRGQKEFAASKGVDDLSEEVKQSMRDHPKLWERL